MSSQNFIITAWNIISGCIVDIKICLAYTDVSGQTLYYREGAAENLNKFC